MVFKATLLHCKAVLGKGQPGLMRDEFWYELCPWCRIDHLIWRPAVQHTTTVLQSPPPRLVMEEAGLLNVIERGMEERVLVQYFTVLLQNSSAVFYSTLTTNLLVLFFKETFQWDARFGIRQIHYTCFPPYVNANHPDNFSCFLPELSSFRQRLVLR